MVKFVVVLLLAAATSALAQERVDLARATCTIANRDIEVAVVETVGEMPGGQQTVGQRIADACLKGEHQPTACTSTAIDTETLPAGKNPVPRSYVLRCVPEARVAWAIGVRWTEAALDVQAVRLDLRALSSAPIVDFNGQPQAQLDLSMPLAPEPAWTWSTSDLPPRPGCDSLTLDATAQDRALDVVIGADDCGGYKLHLDATLGGWSSSPLAAKVPPPTAVVKPAEPAPAPAPASSTKRRHPRR